MPLNKSMGGRRVWEPDSEARESVAEREVEVKEERFEALESWRRMEGSGTEGGGGVGPSACVLAAGGNPLGGRCLENAQ